MFSPTRRRFLAAPAMAALAGAGGSLILPLKAHATGAGTLRVTDFGAVGDGQTPCADAFQQAFDRAEQMGGGLVTIPPGTFILEKTPLIPSFVHLQGAGASSVLKGVRTGGYLGSALISNKGQMASGFEGAQGWSITDLAVDSPDTNGIVITHARDVYVSHIYGIESYNHFLDIVGKRVLCENLFLTGRSGTSSFQIDSLHGAQTIWDGQQPVSPNMDGTEAQDVILQHSFITARAGHQGDKPHHDASIHFHGSESSGFVFSNLIIGGAANGFYQDAGTDYHDILISNVRSKNPGRAIAFNPGGRQQRNLVINNFVHAPDEAAGPYTGMEIHGRGRVQMSNIILDGSRVETAEAGLRLRQTDSISIQQFAATGRGGTGIDIDAAGARTAAVLNDISLKHYATGLRFRGDRSRLSYSDARFDGVAKEFDLEPA